MIFSNDFFKILYGQGFGDTQALFFFLRLTATIKDHFYQSSSAGFRVEEWLGQYGLGIYCRSAVGRKVARLHSSIITTPKSRKVWGSARAILKIGLVDSLLVLLGRKRPRNQKAVEFMDSLNLGGRWSKGQR